MAETVAARLKPLFRLIFSMDGLKYATGFTVLVVLTGAAAFQSLVPSKTYFDGLYWAVTTITTVGYGDELPVSTEARVVAILLMLVGIAYFAIVTGAVAERFMKSGATEERSLPEQIRQLADLHAGGALTSEEFVAAKRLLLAEGHK